MNFAEYYFTEMPHIADGHGGYIDLEIEKSHKQKESETEPWVENFLNLWNSLKTSEQQNKLLNSFGLYKLFFKNQILKLDNIDRKKIIDILPDNFKNELNLK